MGASNKFTAEEQLDQISLYWINLNDGDARGLTVHITSADRDVSFDLNGGNRIPRAAERMARSVDELRAAGIGVSKVLLVHDGSLVSHDVFEWLLTMLLPEVELNFSIAAPVDLPQANGRETIVRDKRQAEQLGRTIKLLGDEPQSGSDIVRLAEAEGYDLIVLPTAGESRAFSSALQDDCAEFILRNAPCSVFVASHPALPKAVAS